MAQRRFSLINKPVPAAVAEVNDLSSIVTWANVPDANITQGSVTQHQAALTILETQITDGTILARLATNETITGAWNFAAITATSYDSILAANLLDRTVNEIVTGRWDFESDGSAPQLCIVDSDSNGAATRAFIEYLGKNDVLTGRMGYLSAASGIFTIDNALPNAGIELTNAGVQKLRIDINGVFMSDDTDISGALTATSYGGITEANLLDKTAAETISATWTHTSPLIIQGGAPLIDMVETGVAADNGSWRLLANAEKLNLQTLNDAKTVAVSIFEVQRTGTVVDSITFGSVVKTPASTTARPSLNIPEGTAPSAPVDGDMWVTTTDIFARINGVSTSLIGGGSTVIAFHNTASTLTLANQPNAARFFPIGTTRTAMKLDLTGTSFTQVRLSMKVNTSSASSNTPGLKAMYKTGAWTSPIGDYSDLGTVAVKASLASTGLIDSTFRTLASAAKADIVIVIMEEGGDAVADPVIGSVTLEFK